MHAKHAGQSGHTCEKSFMDTNSQPSLKVLTVWYKGSLIKVVPVMKLVHIDVWKNPF